LKLNTSVCRPRRQLGDLKEIACRQEGAVDRAQEEETVGDPSAKRTGTGAATIVPGAIPRTSRPRVTTFMNTVVGERSSPLTFRPLLGILATPVNSSH
jgi:hypothetical protein